MSGYIGNDGSALAGGLNPSSVIQGLALDASGKLLVAQTLGGAALSATNPEPNISNIQQLILQGQGFTGTTGKQTAAAAAQVGAALFAGSLAKTVLIYSARVYVSANANVQINAWTANDAALTSAVALAAANDKLGGPAPLAAMTYIDAAVVASGTEHDFTDVNSNVIAELMQPGKFIVIPANTAGGLAIYPILSGANVWAVTFCWVEF